MFPIYICLDCNFGMLVATEMVHTTKIATDQRADSGKPGVVNLGLGDVVERILLVPLNCF
jgi:hypothetical protein